MSLKNLESKPKTQVAQMTKWKGEPITLSGGIQALRFKKTTPTSVPKTEHKLWLSELERYASEFLAEAFPLSSIPSIPITIDNRLRTTGGYAQLSNNDPSYHTIYIQGRILQLCALNGFQRVDLAYIESILRHELIHYALFFLNEPYGDGQSTFELCCYLTNTLASANTNKAYVYKTSQDITELKHYYSAYCVDGHLVLKRTRRHSKTARCYCDAPLATQPNELVIVPTVFSLDGSRIYKGETYDKLNPNYSAPRGLFE